MSNFQILRGLSLESILLILLILITVFYSLNVFHAHKENKKLLAMTQAWAQGI